MRSFRSLSVTASALAISALMAPAVANAQVAQTPTGQVPPGTPESSTQDDDPSASTQQDTDTAATAQETAAPLDTGSGDNTIVVTGSRIARPEFSEPNPIQAYTSESIQQAGNQTFYKRGKQWIAENAKDVDVAQDKNVKHITQFSDEYFALIKDNTKDENEMLARQQEGEEFVVKLRGQVYCIK